MRNVDSNAFVDAASVRFDQVDTGSVEIAGIETQSDMSSEFAREILRGALPGDGFLEGDADHPRLFRKLY